MARNTEEDSKPGKKGKRGKKSKKSKKGTETAMAGPAQGPLPWNDPKTGGIPVWQPPRKKKGGVIRGMKSGGLARRRRS